MIGISGLDFSGGQVSMTLLTAEAGFRYELECCTNLVEAAWLPVVYNINGDGQDKPLTFSAVDGPEAFYRLNRK